MKESAFKFATILMKSDYRHQVILITGVECMCTVYYSFEFQIDEKYRKKIESVIRKAPRAGSQSDDIVTRTEPCPYCRFDLPVTSLTCISCKSTIPFCIASVRKIYLETNIICYYFSLSCFRDGTLLRKILLSVQLVDFLHCIMNLSGKTFVK